MSYKKALSINDESPECHFNLASAFNDLKKFKEANEHYDRAIELDEENFDAYICKGNICEQLKKYDIAKHIYKTALQIDPNNTKILEALQKLDAVLAKK